MQNQSLPLSIIVPVYNADNFLIQCVDSILSQDFKDYELWLIDDGSKDSSIEIIKEYAERDARIKTAFIHGSGPSIPRNYGLRRASGEYILFVDSDDYLPQGALSTLMAKARQFPSAVFIRGNQCILINEEKEWRSVFAEPRSRYADQIIDGERFMTDVLDNDLAPIDALFKRQYLKDHDIEFHEELCFLEDGPFIAEICSNHPDCVYINEETYVYRLGNPTSVTNTKTSFAKCKSLTGGVQYYKALLPKQTGTGKRYLQKRAVEHSVTAMYQSCMWLDRKEAQSIFEEVRRLWRKMPGSGRSRLHSALIRVYNIHPALAFNLLLLLRTIKRH